MTLQQLANAIDKHVLNGTTPSREEMQAWAQAAVNAIRYKAHEPRPAQGISAEEMAAIRERYRD